MRNEKITRITDQIFPVRQQLWNSCGTASLRIVYQSFGFSISEYELRKEMEPYQDQGITWKEMIEHAQHLGFSVRFRQNATYEDLLRLYRRDIPTIVGYHFHINGVEGPHTGVIKIATDKAIVIADPQLNDYNIFLKDTFVSDWYTNDGEHEFLSITWNDSRKKDISIWDWDNQG